MTLIPGQSLNDPPKDPYLHGLKNWLEQNITKESMKSTYNKVAEYQEKEMSKPFIPEEFGGSPGYTMGDFYDSLGFAGGLKPVGKKLLKAAKEANEELITVYRGVDKWHKGSMVEKGKFIGNYQRGATSERGAFHTAMTPYISGQYGRGSKGVLLEFKVPKSYVLKHGKKLGGSDPITKEHLDFMKTPLGEQLKNTRFGHIIFDEGLPKAFFKKLFSGATKDKATLPLSRISSMKQLEKMKKGGVNMERFFERLDWNKGGKNLWDTLKSLDTKVLTGGKNLTSNAISRGKRGWVKKNLNLPSKDVIIETKKEIFASSNSVLIDDTLSNIQKFRKAGGKAILHKGSENRTIKHLNQMIKKNPNLKIYVDLDGVLVDLKGGVQRWGGNVRYYAK